MGEGHTLPTGKAGGYEKPTASILSLLSVTIALIGVQFCWASEFVVTTPYFDSVLGAQSLSQTVWAVGPITGFLVQPIVGSMSDNCRSRMGRRRPFILIGTIFSVVGMALFSNSHDIGVLMGDEPDHRPAGIAIAVLSFCVMDLSINTLQGPLRALASDIAAQHQQGLVQSLATLMQAIGDVTGNLTSFLWFTKTCADVSCTQNGLDKDAVRWSSLIAYGLLAVTCSITICTTKETPLSRLKLFDAVDSSKDSDDESQTRSLLHDEESSLNIRLDPEEEDSKRKRKCCGECGNIFKEIFRGILKMPGPMVRICIVQVFSWFAWFCFLPVATEWMGTDVLHGMSKPTDSCKKDCTDMCRSQLCDYTNGVAKASIALMGKAGVQFVFSFLIPLLLRKIPLKVLWFFSYIVMVIGLFGMWAVATYVDDKEVALPLSIAFIVLMGIPFTATNTFPFAVIGEIFNNSTQQGLFMGTLNIFIVIPQLLDTTYTGAITNASSISVVLLVGGCWAIVAALSIFLVKAKASNRKAGHRSSSVVTEEHALTHDALGDI